MREQSLQNLSEDKVVVPNVTELRRVVPFEEVEADVNPLPHSMTNESVCQGYC